MANQTKPPSSAYRSPGEGYPRLDSIRKDPIVASVVDKMVQDPANSSTLNRGRRQLRAPDLTLLQNLSLSTANNIVTSSSLLQMLPDTELAMQILISSILSPKDMVSTELNYSVEQGQFNSELAGPLLECIRNHFEGTYKMGDLLPKILQDVLFYTGSYPLLVLPENSIDEVINSPTRVSLEAVRDEIDFEQGRIRSLGILGNPEPTTNGTDKSRDFMGLESLAMSFEAFRRRRQEYDPKVARLGETGLESYLTVTDNPNVLKLPMLQDKMRQDRLQDILATRKLSMESQRGSYYNHHTQQREEGSLYRRRRYTHQPVVTMPASATLKKKSVGHPLVMRLPSESVIPVHVPSNPEEHLGYFVLLDEMGNPLVRATETDYYRNMGANISNNTMVNQLIQKTKGHQAGLSDPFYRQNYEVAELTRIYTELVETELLQRLRNGVYGDNVQISRPTEVYRIMLARSLARMHTQVLYVPAEMMTYIAFDYDDHGIGVSLIQKSKVLGSLRMMIAFANTMAGIKNSVGRTKLGITLDPNDDDPAQTVEYLLHDHARLRSASFPLGVSDPSDVLTYLQNAGIEVEVNGNAAYPETKLMVEDVQSNRTKPDSDLEEQLKNRHLMALGLSPETVDAGAKAEFATTVMANNLLLTKRVLMYQRQYVSYLEDHIRKYTLNSGFLMDEMRKIIRDNMERLNSSDQRTIEHGQRQAEKNERSHGEHDVEERPLETNLRRPDVSDSESDSLMDSEEGIDKLIVQFVEALRVSLPQPDISTLENQIAAFDKYAEALDKTLGVYISEEVLSGTEMSDLTEYIEPAVKAVRAYYLRRWLRNNNVMPELEELTALKSDDEPVLDLLEAHSNHVEGIGKSVLGYLKTVAATLRARQNEVAKVKQDLTEAVGSGDDTGGDTDDQRGGNVDTDGDGATDDLTDASSFDEFDTDSSADSVDNPDATPGEKPAEGAEGVEAEEVKEADDEEASPASEVEPGKEEQPKT